VRPVVVLADAVADLEKARQFYNRQEQGVGEYCVESLLSDISNLANYSGIHSKHFGCFRLLGSRFPFGIYYQEIGEATYVMAILDLRRDPMRLRSQITRRQRKQRNP
jgi:hypothetical protein